MADRSKYFKFYMGIPEEGREFRFRKDHIAIFVVVALLIVVGIISSKYL